MSKFADLARRIEGCNMLALEKLRLQIVTSLKEADQLDLERADIIWTVMDNPYTDVPVGELSKEVVALKEELKTLETRNTNLCSHISNLEDEISSLEEKNY